MPPQVNATLLKVSGAGEGGGTGGDFGHADAGGDITPGPSKWTGERPAYYSERVTRTAGDTGTNVDILRELIIDTGDVADLIDTDDVLTFALEDGPEQTGTAREIARHRLAGIPPELQTTRLVLEIA
jgi:hypothetical protein